MKTEQSPITRALEIIQGIKGPMEFDGIQAKWIMGRLVEVTCFHPGQLTPYTLTIDPKDGSMEFSVGSQYMGELNAENREIVLRGLAQLVLTKNGGEV